MVTMLSFAHDFEVDGIYYNITSSSEPYEVAVTYQGEYYNAYRDEYSGVVTIPTSVTYNSKTYSVTSIGGSAFLGCTGLTAVTIGSGVTSIGGYAFDGCTGLTAVTIGSSVTSIGDGAFYGSTNLKKVIVKNIANWCKIHFKIREDDVNNPIYYAHCLYSDDDTEITDLVIPEGVTSIGAYAFYNCESLKSVTVPKSLTSIGTSDFMYCSNISSFRIPKGTWSSNSSKLKPAYYFNQIYSITEVENGVEWVTYTYNLPNYYYFYSTSYYDYNGDGKMEFLTSKSNHHSLYDRYGHEIAQIGTLESTCNSIMPMNGLGECLLYNNDYITKYNLEYVFFGTNRITVDDLISIADIDSDGRKDLVERYRSSDSKYTIHFQQPDGTFKAVEQSATLDEETLTRPKNTGGGGGVVSFGVGMMVKAPKRQTAAADSEVKKVNSATYNTGGYAALDMTDDGILDIMGGSTYTLYSYDDNKYFASYIKRTLFPCDLNGDSELDYIFYDGSNIILQLRTSGTEYEEKTLFTNSNVKKIIFKDFDHDGDIDILAYIKDGNTYFVFFRNEGDLSFKRKERNFALDYDLRDITDVDADGLYELTVYDYTNKKTKVLKVEENLALTEIDITSEIDVVGDFDNDGKMDYSYRRKIESRNSYLYVHETGLLSESVNTAPQKMETPTATLNAEAGRLRINWKQGSDKETSSCDLTYELRIGTQPASGDVLFGASLADGTRRSLDEGNMGRSLTMLFNANSLKPGKYYISVQAIDGGGRGGAWSDDFVYEHQLANPIIVSNYIETLSTADTLLLSVKTPIEDANYQWTLSEGRILKDNGSSMECIFEQDGEHTINLAMTVDGRTLNAEPLTLTAHPYTYHDKSVGYVDINQDGYPEYLGYANDGKGNMEKVVLSYTTQVSTGEDAAAYLDYNMDGYPDALTSKYVLINAGDQDHDFELEEVNLRFGSYSSPYEVKGSSSWFDANNDGFLDNQYGYNDGFSTEWVSGWYSTDSKHAIYNDNGSIINKDNNGYDLGVPNYDVNRDGFLDIVKAYWSSPKYYWYVKYKAATADWSYSAPELMYKTKNGGVIADFNNDGFIDILTKKDDQTLILVKGTSSLPYKEEITIQLPFTMSGSLYSNYIHDYNNDGFLDVLINYYILEFGPDFSWKIVNSQKNSSLGHFMVQSPGGYPGEADGNIRNLPPSAPASVAAKQTKDGLLITWSDAQDDHTPAMQMRYNISVKRKGKKGDDSFVISPMNGLKDAATICDQIVYKQSTQMLMPVLELLTAGETYEIQVQAIDLWNQHSPMTKAIEFTMMSNGYIDVAEQVATDKETTVKFVGSQASSYSLNAGDGATIVSDKGNGEYIVKWATEGVKSITLTAGSATVKSSVTVVKPIDLTFAVPATVFAKAPLTIEVSDEMAKAAKNVGLRCNDGDVKVEYIAGSKTANVTFPATGTYTLEAYSTDEVKGNTYSQVVNVTAVMPHAAIKQVDADAATGSYAISWNADALPAGISKMIISKEGRKLGQFDEIGTVAATAGRYVDLSSNASVMASRYCIHLVAENGQMSEVSVAHKPLHVMITNAAQGFNLIWDSYEGMDVESYSILRGSTPDNLQEIAQVAGSVNSYTDISAPSGVSYYAVTFTTSQPLFAYGQKRTKVAEETINSNIISTESAIDVVAAERLEIIVLDEETALTDDHTDLQLYYMILPTYTTVNKVAWEIVEGKDIATIDANGKLHATGGDGMVVVRVKTIDGSYLTDEISVNCAVTNQSTSYTLTYKVDGEVYKNATVAYGTAITPEAAPTKEGYTFSGWSEIPATMPAHDVTITGTFSVNSYTLTYKVDGEVYKNATVAYGTAITPETAPTKEGYTFSGWSEIPATMPANDVVITGTFSVNNYTLTYKVDGEVYKTATIAYGTAITPETAPTKEGYTFSGWSEIPETMPANDVTITGTFSINSYKLTYTVDGQEYKSYDVEYGATITPETAPTKEGYTFSGWSEIPEMMPAHDVTVTGTFTLDTGINQIMGNENGDAMIFTIEGKRVDNMKKGMNVIRMKDGTTRKVVVK